MEQPAPLEGRSPGAAMELSSGGLSHQEGPVEESLREAVERGIQTGIAAIGPDGRQTYVNPAFCRMLGWEASELVGALPPFVYWPEEEVPRIRAAFTQTLAGAAPARAFDLRFRRRNGERFNARLAVTALRDPEGKLLGWLATVEDTTERKRAVDTIAGLNRELERRLKHFEALLDLIPVGIGVAEDPECRRIRVNRAFAGMLGIPPDANASKTGPEPDRLPFRVFRDGKEVPSGDLPMQVAAREGVEVRACELEWRRNDGVRYDIFGYACPLFDEHGNPYGSLGAFVDVTELKRAEAERRKGEAMFRDLADAMPQIVWSALPDGRVDYRNRRWYEFTGLPEGPESEEHWTTAVHPEDVARCREAWARSLRTGSQYEIEYRLREGRTGQYRWQLARALPVRDESGQIVRWFGTFTDLDDQKRADEKLSQKQKLESIGLLAGGVAHDFNNLLTGILGNASLLLEGAAADSPDRHMLEDLVNAASRAADLTRQLLAYSGKGRFVLKRVDLSLLVRDIVSLMQVGLSKKVDLELILADDIPSVEADPGQLQQVIMNLVINGAEAVGEERSGTVSVTTSIFEGDPRAAGYAVFGEQTQPGRYVCLQVEDTGCGMDEGTLARIFDPFFTTKFTGRGLGLSAVLGVVRGHRGAIRVSSQPGRGTCFWILFPALCEISNGAAAPVQVQEDLRGSGTILVVDDEELIRRTCRHSLEHYGYRVLSASNGLEALEVLERHRDSVSLVLLDMSMPVMSGVEALPHLRRIAPNLPVILTSGFAENEAARRFGSQGWTGFLQKPYVARELASRVSAALKQV